MEESAGKDLEVERSGAINDAALSQSDDLVIFVSSSSAPIEHRSSGPANETSFEQLGTVELDADKTVDREQFEQMPQLLQTPEPEKSQKNAKFNLRKSLAWDSAFFTNDGVLDADELSTMIEGGDKGVKHCLPGIEEEVYRSMESISTLESDNLTLECLEAELFEDIRASIQRSNGSSKLNNSSIKVSSGKRDIQAKVGSSSKKVNLDSGKRPAARVKDHTSSIPQPKIISRLTSTPTLTKRASLSANHAKKDQDIAKQAHGTQAAKTTTQGSKVSGVIGPCRGLPKPSLNSRSSSCGSSGSSSGNDAKSSETFSRRKADPKTGKLTMGSIPKTPSRINMKNKAPPANSRISSNLVLQNLSSSISPASSITSESSSTTSTINRRPTSRGSIDTVASQRSLNDDVSVESALGIHPTGRNSNQTIVVPPSQSGSLSRPPTFQPTGLRMPSPKIGFFDGGKSGARTPNGGIRSQSRIPTGVPKTGPTHCSPTSSNVTKFGKLPPPKTAAAQTKMKPNLQKTIPKPSQKTSSKSCPVASNDMDHKGDINLQTEGSVNDSNKESHLGNKSSNKMDTQENCQVEMLKDAVKDHKVDNSSRTPFAVMNSVCDTSETAGMEVTEKSGIFPFVETKENSEVI